MARRPPLKSAVGLSEAPGPSPAPQVRETKAAPEVVKVMDAVRDRLRVLEGEVYVWYDRLVDRLAHVDPDDLTDLHSRHFFDCAHFLSTVASGMVDDSDLTEEESGASLLDGTSDLDRIEDVSPEISMDSGDSGALEGGLSSSGARALGGDALLYEEATSSPVEDPQGLALFLRDLKNFLMLDFDVRGQQPTGRLGKDFLQGACDRADELIQEVRAAGPDPLCDKFLVRRLQRVRQHPSRLLAHVMMRRINLAFPDRPELQFHYGRALETQLLDEIDQVDGCPESFTNPHVVGMFELMREGALQRFRDTLQSAGKDPHLLDRLERLSFHREVACTLDRYGGIKPSFGEDFIALMRLAFSRLKADASLGERHYFDHLSLGRTREAFSQERNALVHIEQKTLKSDVCNLPNQRAFNRLIEPYFRPTAGGERRGQLGSPVVVFMDLNGFKAVNDWAKPTRVTDAITQMSQLFHSYPLGDQVLYQAGEVMKSVLRSGQELFHLHGDEYALVLPSGTPHEGVLRVLTAMQEQLFQLAKVFDMHRSDNDEFMNLGIAAGFDRLIPGKMNSLKAFSQHIGGLMGYAKHDATGVYRSFEDKCSYVVGPEFGQASGRYDRNGQFLEQLPWKST